jgi:capsular exopolysaccharide synthesis family protein
VDTVEEVAQSLGLPVVGALPDSSRPVPRRRLPVGITAEAYTQAVLTESVDATRAMLVHAARTEGVQVVMITSALPGEGKTSLSCHLAASLARVGHKTLLIDGDMRNPMAHRLFELPNGAGLSEVLRGEAEAEQVTQRTVLPHLSLIAGGHWDGGAAAGLAQGGARALFDRLRKEYDFILVDSSPVLPVADALLVGQSADAVVFSILRDVSRLPNVYLASQRLAAMGARTLGAVLNGVPGGLYVSSYTYAAVGQAPAQAG